MGLLVGGWGTVCCSCATPWTRALCCLELRDLLSLSGSSSAPSPNHPAEWGAWRLGWTLALLLCTCSCSCKDKHGVRKNAEVVWCVTAFLMRFPLGKTKMKRHKIFFPSHSAGLSGAMGKEIPELLFWTCLQSKYGECAWCVLGFIMQDLSLLP